MQPILPCEANRSLFVPAGLSVLGRPGGDWVPMRTESIDRTGLFIITKEYVKPRAIFDVLIWLTERQVPLSVTVTASFVERTWDGYGVWAQISSISTSVREIWEYFYENAALRCDRGYSESIRIAQSLDPQHIVVLGDVLPGYVHDLLHRLGTTIDLAQSAEQAYALARNGAVDVVVMAAADPHYDMAALCQQLAALPTPPHSLAILNSSRREDFEAALYGGVTKVIARPCSNAMLATRLLELLSAVKRARVQASPPPRKSLWKDLPRRVASLLQVGARGASAS